jgi:ABC-type branched-subunit amino acid transport system substrate-binding protein
MGSLFRSAIIGSSVLFCFALTLFFAPGIIHAQEGDTVYIGLNVPLSGPYKDQGKDEERAYKLAIEQVNNQGGVLGKKLKYVLKDTKTNPKVAAKNARELIQKHGVVMISGGSSSAVAIAQSDVCQKHGVIFMAALTHSNATTGHSITRAGITVQKAHRHTFRWYFNAWMTGKALAPFLVETLGKGATYYYITADYTWGHTLENSMRWQTELAGCMTAGSIRTPLGKKNFKSELKTARASNPDALVLVLFGRDMVIALKEAYEMGLKKDMKIVVPLMELNMAHGVGIDAMEGVIATKNWYWGLKDRFQGSQEFVDAFWSKYGRAPGSAAASAWVAVLEWAAAVERAKSFDSEKVILALEGHSFTLLKDKEKWRHWDHQAVSSVYIVKGKSASESKGEWDILSIIAEKSGPSVMRSIGENPVSLEFLKSENKTEEKAEPPVESDEAKKEGEAPSEAKPKPKKKTE